MVQRRVDPRHPLDGTAGVVRNCRGLWRWRVVLAAATRPAVGRRSAAARRGGGTGQHGLHAILFHARAGCVCTRGEPSCGNGYEHEERGCDLQVYTATEHGLNPRRIHYHCPRRRNHCLVRLAPALAFRRLFWRCQQVYPDRLTDAGERDSQLPQRFMVAKFQIQQRSVVPNHPVECHSVID